MEVAVKTITLFRSRLSAYWALTKNLQTGLLLITGLAGYMSARPERMTWGSVAALLGSLFLAVGGSTVLNMVIDRDIDALMKRTQRRPLPSGALGAAEAGVLGALMAGSGIGWAVYLAPVYGAVVAAGLLLDVVMYTLWLKRRTAWSIFWGGIAGGMPALAGRALGLGRLDEIGFLLALAVLLWIPTHMLSFSIRYAEDYQRAGVPVFPNRFGIPITRLVIGLSTAGAVIVMLWVVYQVGVNPVLLWSARALGGVLAALTLVATLHTTSKLAYILYKSASVYMLLSMFVLIAGA